VRSDSRRLWQLPLMAVKRRFERERERERERGCVFSPFGEEMKNQYISYFFHFFRMFLTCFRVPYVCLWEFSFMMSKCA
jgi:hypothetical protein